MTETPHHCRCTAVSACSIYTHPSAAVQQALNALVEALTIFDALASGQSQVLVVSEYPGGIFTTYTRPPGSACAEMQRALDV